jgi:hypothetical protein
VFKRPPYELLRRESGVRPEPNVLRLRIQPEERISLSFETKVPGRLLKVEEVRMDFSYASSFGAESPEAYERLLRRGAATRPFAREDEELSKLVDAITGVGRDPPGPFTSRPWGPEADQLRAERAGDGLPRRFRARIDRWDHHAPRRLARPSGIRRLLAAEGRGRPRLSRHPCRLASRAHEAPRRSCPGWPSW